MRVAVYETLAAAVCSTLLACAPETVAAPANVGATAEGGKPDTTATRRADPGSKALATAPIQVSPPVSADAASTPPTAAPMPMAESAATLGEDEPPTAAVARIGPFMAKPGAAGSGSASKTANTTPTMTGAAGAAAGQPPPQTAQEPAAEVCEGLRALPVLSLDRRFLALLVACEALDLSASAGAAGAAAPSGSMVPATSAAQAGRGGDAAAGTHLEATAVFTPVADGVSVLLVLDGCRDGAAYSVRIHAGHNCADTTSIGEQWDDTRGDGIPDLHCMGAQASQQYVRPSNAAKNWSVGGALPSDVIGQVVVINDPDDRTVPVACGEIVAP